MIIKVSSSNTEIKHKLTFLFENQIKDELEYIFVRKGEYVVEYDEDGGVLGLVLKITTDPIPEWETIDTRTLPPIQCLNRIAMIHMMSFFASPADFSNFSLSIDFQVRCDCGGSAANTTHSLWCSKYE